MSPFGFVGFRGYSDQNRKDALKMQATDECKSSTIKDANILLGFDAEARNSLGEEILNFENWISLVEVVQQIECEGDKSEKTLDKLNEAIRAGRWQAFDVMKKDRTGTIRNIFCRVLARYSSDEHFWDEVASETINISIDENPWEAAIDIIEERRAIEGPSWCI